MKIYRIENPNKRHGVWYDRSGNVNEELKLFPDACRTFPMPKHETYSYSNQQWFSATDTAEKLTLWYTIEDVLGLEKFGYFVYEIESDDVRYLNEKEVVFIRDKATFIRKMNPYLIWK